MLSRIAPKRRATPTESYGTGSPCQFEKLRSSSSNSLNVLTFDSFMLRVSLRVSSSIKARRDSRAEGIVEVEEAIGIGGQVGETGFPWAEDIAGAINKI